MATGNPFLDTERRPHTDGLFHANEVGLSNRNSGILLETLRHDVTPAGLHYLLNHFDVPYVAGRPMAGRDRWPREEAAVASRSRTSSACRRARSASRWNARATDARP